MNQDLPQNPREELEARLTALLLGELPPEEADALRRTIGTDAALARLQDRLKRTMDLVSEAAASPSEQTTAQSPPLKLSEERRQKLLARFKTVAPKEFAGLPRRNWSWALPMAAAAAAIVILAALAIPNFTRARTTAQRNAIINNLRQIDSAKQQWALETHKSANDVPALSDIMPYLGRGENQLPPPVTGESYKLGRVGESPTAQVNQGGRVQQITLPDEPQLAPENKKLSLAEVSGKSTSESAAESLSQVTAALASPPVRTSGPSAPTTANRTEIFLPAGGELVDTAKDQLETRVFHVDPNTFTTSQESPGAFPLGSIAQNTDGTGGGVAGGIFNGARSDHQFSFPSVSFAGGRVAGEVVGGSVQAIIASNIDKDNQKKRPADGTEDLAHSSSNRFVGRPAYATGTGPGEPQAPASVTTALPGKPEWIGVLSREGEQALEAKAESVPGLGNGPGAKGTVQLRGWFDDGKSLGLGDVPVAGGLFRSTNETVDAAGYSSAVTRDAFGLKPQEAPAFAPKPAEQLQIAEKQLAEQNGRLPSAEEPKREKQIAAKADSVASLVQEGKTLYDMGRLDDAEAKLKDAAGSDPSNTQAWYYRALIDESRYAKRVAKPETLAKNKSMNGEIAALPNSTSPELGVAASSGTFPDVPLPELAKRNEEVRKAQAKVDEFKTSLNIVDTMDAVVASSKKDDAETIARYRPYFEAKQQLDEAQKIRDAELLRILQEKVDLALPKQSIVEITDPAETQPTKNPTLGQRLAKAMTGKVERTARVAVDKDVSGVTPLGSSQSNYAYDPFFIQTVFEKIRSRAVLDKVIEKLNLNEAWAKKYGAGHKLETEKTLKLLNDALDVRQHPNTSLVDITVKSADPAEAARIANTIAEVYRGEGLKQRQEVAIAGIERLEKDLEKQNKKVASAQEALERLKSEPEIQPPDEDRPIRRPAPDAPVPQPEILTGDNAFSTFSLNVSDVSFKLAQASLQKGVMPDPATVRSEEFINAFDYRDPEPPPSVPVGFAWERARYPFAQNRDLLRFSIRTAAAGRQPGRPLNLVLLLDNSGSMERADRVSIIHEALRALAGQLQPEDKLSVVTFARTPRLWVDGVPGNQAGEVFDKVAGLTPQGGTNLEDAMNLAYATALRHYLADGINRVVLLTDGAANLGNVDPQALKQKVESHRKQGIALDCFGIGWEGFNDDLLEVLSSSGDGRYGFLNSPEEAATRFAGQLAGALKVAASDVKVQVEFNPKRVTAYRQLGYAKHQLTEEQFRDNTVDAAEIGAAEAGNALYVIEVNPRGEGPLGTVRVRYKVPGTSDYREQAWDAPFTGNAVALNQASPALRLAATANAFSEWLVASPFAAEVTPDALLGFLNGVPEVYGADLRPKQLEWMIRQAKSVAGK